MTVHYMYGFSNSMGQIKDSWKRLKLRLAVHWIQSPSSTFQAPHLQNHLYSLWSLLPSQQCKRTGLLPSAEGQTLLCAHNPNALWPSFVSYSFLHFLACIFSFFLWLSPQPVNMLVSPILVPTPPIFPQIPI